MTDLALIAGGLLLAGGVALYSVPAGLISAGLLLFLGALLAAKGEA